MYAEPFNDDGTLASNVFFETIGPTYIDLALQAASAADPNAKLYVSILARRGQVYPLTRYRSTTSTLKVKVPKLPRWKISLRI